MKLIRPLGLLALPLLVACDSEPTTPPAATPRPLTAAEVTAVTGQARSQVLPAFNRALAALETSRVLRELGVELDQRPTDAELADNPLFDALLDEASIETRTDTSITYRARPSVLCEDDAECVQVLTDHPLRATATSLAAGEIQLAVQAGAVPRSIGQFRVRADRVAATLELSGLAQAFVEYTTAFQNDLPWTPTQVAGQVSVEITADSVALSNTDVSVTGQKDQDRFTVTLAAGNLSADLDAAAHTAVGTLALGRASVALPFAWLSHRTVCEPAADPQLPDVCTDHEGTGTMTFRLAGVSTRFHVDASADRVVLDDLGFGAAPLVVEHDGATVVSLDVNPAQNRSGDLALHYLGQELEVAVSPSLDATLALSLASIADDLELGDLAPTQAVQVRFDGATSPTVRVSQGQEEVIARVTSGDLVFTSGSARVEVGVDQCLGVRDERGPGGTVVDALMSFPCE